jgi:hypothetical protein
MSDNPFEVENLEPHKPRRWLPAVLVLLAFGLLVGLFVVGIAAYLWLKMR